MRTKEPFFGLPNKTNMNPKRNRIRFEIQDYLFSVRNTSIDLSWVLSDRSKSASIICWNDSITESLNSVIQKGMFPTEWLINVFLFGLFFQREAKIPLHSLASSYPYENSEGKEARAKPHCMMDRTVTWLFDQVCGMRSERFMLTEFRFSFLFFLGRS